MSFLPLIILLIVWAISAIVAGAIASERELNVTVFAAVTFFFLGPLGPGFALLATHGAIEKSRVRAARATSSPAVPQPSKQSVSAPKQLGRFAIGASVKVVGSADSHEGQTGQVRNFRDEDGDGFEVFVMFKNDTTLYPFRRDELELRPETAGKTVPRPPST